MLVWIEITINPERRPSFGSLLSAVAVITGHNFWGNPGNYVCEIVKRYRLL